MEEERWARLHRFPTYAVSDHGRVLNVKRDSLVKPSVNQNGVGVINLFDREHRHTTKAIGLLVAEAFIPRPEDRFNTPINLDGDRTNNHYRNLLWRPRPFATVYNRQFRLDRFLENETQLEIEDTGEWFPSVRVPSMRFGLIYTAILMSAHNGNRVFPTNQRYRFVKQTIN